MQFIDIAKSKKNNFRLTKKGKYVFFMHNLSGKVVIELNGSGIDCQIYGLYVGKGKDNFQLKTIQHHNAPGSTSNLLVKGVFYDESRFIHEGLIRIEKKAQKSKAYQKNQNIIMSDRCFVDSRPFLEILANDVFCTHGSTTGKLNKEQLYYLGTRGVENKQAEKLLLDGFINEIFTKIKEDVPNFQLENAQ